MNVELTRRAARDLDDLPPRLQQTVRKQLELLANNLRHPSRQAKKHDEGNDLWQGRMNRNYRFYFQMVEETYWIIRIIPHPK
jgi:mRNA-degrading endonuclease RelE of RelBE toxin-antitoxin system